MTASLWELTGDELRAAYRQRDPQVVEFDEDTGSWLVFGHGLVSDVLRDHRTFGQAFRPERPAARFASWNAFKSANMIDRDPPDHRRLRGLVARSFTPRFAEDLRPSIRAMARQQVAGALDRSGRVDVVSDVAEPLAVGVIARMLGVPADDRDDLRRWGDTITRMYEPQRDDADVDAALDALAEFTTYLHGHIERVREEPAPGLLSALVGSNEDDVLTAQEVVSTAILLLNGGHETSVNALGNAVVALHDHPDALDWLRADRSLLSTAADELLRFDSPLRTFPRRALHDVTFAGASIGAGQSVTVMLEAANRDPGVFEHADDLVLDRRPNRHVAFGAGIHVCLGAPLARIELEEALGALLDALPTWRLAAPPQPRPSFQFNGYTSVPIAA